MYSFRIQPRFARPLRAVATILAPLATSAAFTALALAHGPDDEPDYAAIADDFVRSQMPEAFLLERAPAAVTLEELLDVAYVHADVGLFRIHYPKRVFADLSGVKKSITYKRRPNPNTAMEELVTVARTLADLQLRWIELVGKASPGKPIEASVADTRLPGYTTVRNWIATGWSAKAAQQYVASSVQELKRAVARDKSLADAQAHAREFENDLALMLTDPDTEIRAALSTFCDTMRLASFWPRAEDSAERQAREPMSIIVCPTRGEIVGLALHVAREQDTRHLTWHPGVFNYTQVDFAGMAGVTFRYADEGDPTNLFEGRLISDLDEEGGVAQQHTVQHCMAKLLEYYFGPRFLSNDAATPDEQKLAQRTMGSLFGGIKRYMVTYMYGSNQVRDEGDVANRTMAREMFIAGGASEGGSLGGSSAEMSRWRKRANREEDFLRDLLDNMDIEADRGGANLEAQVILKPMGSKKNEHLAPGPFLARQVAAVLPPEQGPPGEKERDKEKRLAVRAELAWDYVGFLRAYEIAFYRWLVGAAEDSGEAVTRLSKHAALYEKLYAEAASYLGPDVPVYDLSAQLLPVVEAAYGKPVTGSTLAEPSLERDFLLWLGSRER